MEGKILLEDHSRGNEKPKYYSISKLGKFAYSNKQQLKDWVNKFDSTAQTGNLSEINYSIIDWKRKEGDRRQDPK